MSKGKTRALVAGLVAVGLGVTALHRFGAEPVAQGFRRAELLETGLEAEHVDALAARFEHARGELAAAANESRKRFGSLPNPHYAAALDRVAAKLQAELGPSDYDWLLYGSGQPNRLIVEGVEPPTEGEPVDLREGDVLHSYLGRRVYSTGDLRRAQLTRQPDQLATAQVERGGELLELRLPAARFDRLGVRLRADSIQPAL